jgi:lipoprotein-anchoring transpeptidase ErfK/SrfK
LFTGDRRLITYVVSTGLPHTPTLPGSFRVWHQQRMQTMRGPGYEVPNVEWVTYFDGDRAFHATYWHSNFGTPMSRGCVNMTYPAAEALYRFAPEGTRVEVRR